MRIIQLNQHVLYRRSSFLKKSLVACQNKNLKKTWLEVEKTATLYIQCCKTEPFLEFTVVNITSCQKQSTNHPTSVTPFLRVFF